MHSHKANNLPKLVCVAVMFIEGADTLPLFWYMTASSLHTDVPLMPIAGNRPPAFYSFPAQVGNLEQECNNM